MTHTLHESGTLTNTRGGNATVTIITPGVGSSGTYPRETIERAATDRVFHAGLLMFADHATEEDTWARPEGSITNLVGVLAEDARWDTGTDGLVAEVRIFEHWKPIIRDMAESIGVSIRAAGEVEDTADGRVVTRLTEARSVDFVTKAGRGGRVMEVLESARPTTLDEITELFRPNGYQNHIGWAAVSERGPEVINFKTSRRQLEPSSIRESARGTETSQLPAGQEIPTQEKEHPMGDITLTEAAHAELAEKASRADTLETKLAEATTKIEAFEAEKAQATRHAHVAGLIEAQFDGIDDPAGVAALLTEKHTAADTDDDTIIAEAKDRAAKLTPTGGVTNLGETRPVEEAKKVTDDDIIAALEGA